jgi:hypothetical protein
MQFFAWQNGFFAPEKKFFPRRARTNVLIDKYLPHTRGNDRGIFRPKKLDIPGKDDTLFLHVKHLVPSLGVQVRRCAVNEPGLKCPR